MQFQSGERILIRRSIESIRSKTRNRMDYTAKPTFRSRSVLGEMGLGKRLLFAVFVGFLAVSGIAGGCEATSRMNINSHEQLRNGP